MIKEIEKQEPRFCSHSPFWIDYELGEVKGKFLCDGEYIVEAPQGDLWVHMKAVTDPPQSVRNLVNNKLFEV